MTSFVESELEALAVKLADKVFAQLEPKLSALISTEINNLVGKL